MFQANVGLWLLSRKDGECGDSKGKIWNVLIVGLELWGERVVPCACEDLHRAAELPAAPIVLSVIVHPRYRGKKTCWEWVISSNLMKRGEKNCHHIPFYFQITDNLSLPI